MALANVPFMALSASALPPLAKVIEESLHLKSPHHVCHSLDRPNIFLSISKSKGLVMSVASIQL
jgi:superfamily II DNA helicase RecQ